MSGILTITLNPALDISTETNKILPNVKVRCSMPRRHPGGGGVNVSRAIAFLGGSSRVAVAAGGETGDTLLRLLRDEGLPAINLRVSHPTRESLNIVESSTGDQYRLLLPGPNWTEVDCATARTSIHACIEEGDIVVPSGSYPPGVPHDFFVTLNRDLKDRNIKTVFDTSGPALAAAAEAQTEFFLLRMNHKEATELVGRDLNDLEAIAEVALRLIEVRAASHVAIAHGPNGTVIASKGSCWHCYPPQVRPVSKVGAGDSFVGAFTLALSKGEEVLDACIYGVAAATSAVMTPDTRLCELSRTEEFREEVKVSKIAIR